MRTVFNCAHFLLTLRINHIRNIRPCKHGFADKKHKLKCADMPYAVEKYTLNVLT